MRWWAGWSALGTLVTGAALAFVAMPLIATLLPQFAGSADVLAVFGNPALWLVLGSLGLLAGATFWLVCGPVGLDEPSLSGARCFVAYPLCCATFVVLILALMDLANKTIPRLPVIYLLGPIWVPSICVIALPWAVLQLAFARWGGRTRLVWWVAMSGLGASLTMVALGTIGTVRWGDDQFAGVLVELFQVVAATGVVGAIVGALFWWLVPHRVGRRGSAFQP